MGNTLLLPLPKNAGRLAYVRALLAANRIKNRHIARKVGVHECTVSLILSGTKKSLRIQKGIAEILNMPFETVWGSPE